MYKRLKDINKDIWTGLAYAEIGQRKVQVL